MNNSNNMSNISFISDISNDNNNSNTINKAPSAKPYSNYQLLFSNMTKEILIISNEELQLINLVSTNQKVVLLLNKTLKVNGTVSNAAIIQNFLYLIINFSRIEIYDIRDFFQYNSINLSQLIEFNSTPIVADIAVNSDFLFILENTTNSCFFFDRLGLFLKNTLFFNGTVYNIQVFESTVLIYYLTFDGKLFLKEYLRFNPDSNYFQENNLFEMGSLVKELSFLSRNMLVSCHENLVTFIRHSVKYPKNVTNVLKKTFAYEGIQFLVPAEVTGTMKNESQFLQELVLVSKKGEVNLLMMNPNSGSLVCTPDNNVVTRKYEISMILYYFNCTDRSCSYLKIQSDKLRVVLSIYQELFESSNIALAIGLGIGFSIAFIVTIIFCVYFYRIKHHYTTLVKEISPEETPKIKKPLTDNAEKNEEKKNEEI